MTTRDMILAFILVLMLTPLEYVRWLICGKHFLTAKDKEYNKKIDELCQELDGKYNSLVNKYVNLMKHGMLAYGCLGARWHGAGAMPYKEARRWLVGRLEAKGFSTSQKRRAVKTLDKYEKINGPDYMFSIGGRSECFLLQARLRETKFHIDEWESPISNFWR